MFKENPVGSPGVQPKIVPFEGVTPLKAELPNPADGGGAMKLPDGMVGVTPFKAEAPNPADGGSKLELPKADSVQQSVEVQPVAPAVAQEVGADAEAAKKVEDAESPAGSPVERLREAGVQVESVDQLNPTSPEGQAQKQRVQEALQRLAGRGQELAEAVKNNPAVQRRLEAVNQCLTGAVELGKKYIKYNVEGILAGKSRDERKDGWETIKRGDQMRLASMELAANPRIAEDIKGMRDFLQGNNFPPEMLFDLVQDRFPDKADQYLKILDHPDAQEFFAQLDTQNLKPELAARLIEMKFNSPPKATESQRGQTELGRERASTNPVRPEGSLQNDPTTETSGNADAAEEVAGSQSTPAGGQPAAQAAEGGARSGASAEMAPAQEQRESVKDIEAVFEGNISPGELYMAQAQEYARINVAGPEGDYSAPHTATIDRNVPSSEGGSTKESIPLSFGYDIPQEMKGKPEAFEAVRKDRAAQMKVAETLMRSHQSGKEDKLQEFESQLKDQYGSENVEITKIGPDGVDLKSWTEGMRVKTQIKDGKISVTFEDAGDVQMGPKFTSESKLKA